jgi:hypothetical protein
MCASNLVHTNVQDANASNMFVQVAIEQFRKRKQVVLSMNVKGTKMNIIFSLLQDIDVIVARCSDKDKSQYVLETLFPDDAGDTWPAGKQPTGEDMHSMARPYRYKVVPLYNTVQLWDDEC